MTIARCEVVAKLRQAGPADVVKMMTEVVQAKKPSVAYTPEYMANDAAGLLDVLRIDRADILGASLGGGDWATCRREPSGENAIVHLNHVLDREQRASYGKAQSDGSAAESLAGT